MDTFGHNDFEEASYQLLDGFLMGLSPSSMTDDTFSSVSSPSLYHDANSNSSIFLSDPNHIFDFGIGEYGISYTESGSSVPGFSFSAATGNTAAAATDSSRILTDFGVDSPYSQFVSDSASESSTPSPYRGDVSSSAAQSTLPTLTPEMAALAAAIASSSPAYYQQVLDQLLSAYGVDQFASFLQYTGGAATAATAATTAASSSAPTAYTYDYVATAVNEYDTMIDSDDYSADASEEQSGTSSGRKTTKRKKTATATRRHRSSSTDASSSPAASSDTDSTHGGNVTGKKRNRTDEERENARAERQAKLNELTEIRKKRKLTAEEYALLKAIRNYITAQDSRDRKKYTIDSLYDENNELREQIAQLQRRVKELEQEIAAYKATGARISAPTALNVFLVVFCVGLACFGFLGGGSGGASWRSFLGGSGGSDGYLVATSASDDYYTDSADVYTTTAPKRNILITDESKNLPVPSPPAVVSKNVPSVEDLLTDHDRVMITYNGQYEEVMDLGDHSRYTVLIPSKLKQHFVTVPGSSHEHADSAAAAAAASSAASTASGSSSSPSQYTGKEGNQVNLVSCVGDLQKIGGGEMDVGYVYRLAGDEDETSSGSSAQKKTLYFFCPFMYNMLPMAEDGTIKTDADGKISDVRFYVPYSRSEIITSENGDRVIRVTEIRAKEMYLSDVYVALDKDGMPNLPSRGKENVSAAPAAKTSGSSSSSTVHSSAAM